MRLPGLRRAGCREVFQENASGGDRDRPQLKAALARVGRGDTLVVARIDRLARWLGHLPGLVATIHDAVPEGAKPTLAQVGRQPGRQGVRTATGARTWAPPDVKALPGRARAERLLTAGAGEGAPHPEPPARTKAQAAGAPVPGRAGG